uniref:inter-alpha-trypsin inhibitor heavy chain H4 isoform X4 n=1 Tax=Jaculus jaculus TaxID=51337 RepID=UPI001E1AFA67|nr:inter-alpha-trypsin inhibitor heavy chain H4 isoform X4 [Jaculus jaculus]
MKIPAPANMWNIVLVLPSLVAVLQTTTAQKNGIDIYSLNVDSKISSRFAHTVITSRVVNKADAAQEATFQMELPKKAFITNFSMIIDGVTYPGNIKDKAAAQEQYRAAVGRGESAGLVKTTGRKTEQFEVSVSVAPAAKVTFELVYEELLKRHLGVYELLLKVRPQQLVKHLQMDIHIFEPQGISFLETESTFMTKELEDALTTSQNKTKAHIQFKPTLAQQQKSPDKQETLLDGNFIVRYDVNRSRSVGSIQIENGYFVHYFAPEDLPIMPKNVIFVIDKSSSMFGRKIQQTREALIKILKDLSPKDQFNIIVFSGEASQWKPSLVRASAENVKKATDYASRIQARGGTNINDAMLMAVKLLDRSNRAELLPEGSVSLIILLTDGDPTVGETNPKIIQKNVQKAINSQYSLFCLGFGFDVSYSFLEKLAMDNGGLARRIYEDSDSALQLQDFYQEVANPLLSTVAFEYPSNAVEAVTQDNFRLLFKGSEIVVAGKIRDEGPDVLSAKVRGQTHMQNITFQGEANVAQQEEEFRSPKYIFHNFMERLWAYLTIQQQLEQRVSASDAEIKTLEAKALNLSLKYNFVTPLTSMVVTKPEGQEQSQIAEKPVAEKPVEYDGGLQLAYMGMSHVTSAPSQPVLNGPTIQDQVTGPPQAIPIILPFPGLNSDPLCVDLPDLQGPMNLFSDPSQGTEVTGQYETEKDGFAWIEVTFKDPQLQVHATPERVVVTRNQKNSEYKWKETLFSVLPGLKMTMDNKGLLLFTGQNKVTIGLLSGDGPGKGLLLLLRDTHHFSSHVNGTLGQFYQDLGWESPVTADDNRGTLRVQGRAFPATRELKMDYQEGFPGTKISCWSVKL